MKETVRLPTLDRQPRPMPRPPHPGFMIEAHFLSERESEGITAPPDASVQFLHTRAGAGPPRTNSLLLPPVAPFLSRH